MTADAVGGVWQYAIELSTVLANRGDRITIAVFGPELSEDQCREAEAIEGVKIVETGQPLDWLCSSPAEVERAARELATLARSRKADLIHCNMPALAGSADFATPLVAVAHGCIATWWNVAKSGPLSPRYAWHRDLMARGLKAADAIVAPSASFAGSLVRTYRLESPPVVVHNSRSGFAPGDQSPVDAVLTIGRLWDEVKSARLLDKVAGKLALPFRAVGPMRGPHGEQAAPFSHLETFGQVRPDRLAQLLAKRPIFVSAARFEPFGLAVLEAASTGCALVLSDIETFRELWDGAALFVAPDDADGFAAAIAALHADPALRLRMGNASQRQAARLTPEKQAEGMDAVYRGLLKEARAAA